MRDSPFCGTSCSIGTLLTPLITFLIVCHRQDCSRFGGHFGSVCLDHDSHSLLRINVPRAKYVRLVTRAACTVILEGVVLALAIRLATWCPSYLRLIRVSALTSGALAQRLLLACLIPYRRTDATGSHHAMCVMAIMMFGISGISDSSITLLFSAQTISMVILDTCLCKGDRILDSLPNVVC
ncbi:uncharacterized protein BDZ83DRAFT_361190 [Colletotrichum acutatum]|uniref:Uncharacterized protein n=1 Tax=Glomerella acutata TaxID=27357 RepID=A0AAD8XEG1_GLOAC|nr:uncharacterized protein BDZ83DRAFT_361190 [Colletotrichum acutatum]KAK1724227.1 hypothetical protein BDZ83DRAFT_361190 [Colletotrichum acutatum]